MKAPEWMRLDNAALIYPSCRTRKYAVQYRISATLDKDISVSLLDSALKNIMPRFPGFGYTLSKGFFWWYLRRLDNEPSARLNETMNVFSLKDNGGFMFKVGCTGNVITLDVFHALTDGTGAMTFLMTLASEYIRLKENVCPEFGKWVFNPLEQPAMEELEDSFDGFSGLKGNLDKEEKAWHIAGKTLPYDILENMKVSLSSEDVAAKAASYGCNVTEFLSSVLLLSLQDTWKMDKSSRKSPFIVLEIPVNLRPMFGSRTLRNFSSYIHVGLDVRNGFFTLEEIIADLKMQKALFLQKNRLTTRVAANQELEDNLAIRCIPLFIKKHAINIINRMKGDTYCTYTFSNLGRIDAAGPNGSHIRGLDFILGRTMRRSGACACVSCNGRLNLNFSRKLEECEFEKIFLGHLSGLGVCASVGFGRVAGPQPKTKRYPFQPMRRSRVGMASSLLFI